LLQIFSPKKVKEWEGSKIGDSIGSFKAERKRDLEEQCHEAGIHLTSLDCLEIILKLSFVIL
jgi:hypothetical protein